MIQDIEGLNPELEIERLRYSRNAGIFEKRYISFDQAWSNKLISPLVSPGRSKQRNLTICWRGSTLITERGDRGTDRDSGKCETARIDVVESVVL